MALIFILCMFLGSALLADISQSKSTNNGLDNEMVLLRELHAAFCGEDFLCKNDSSYWETPGELVMPKPCCMPCSCSPTCGNRSDCCPAFRDNGTVDDARLETSGATHEYMTNQNDTTDDAIAHSEDISSGTFEDSDTTSLTTCVRPQVFYRPNHALDSEAYEMVATCPEWFKDVETIEKCHAGLHKAGPFDVELFDKNLVDMIPVTSILTGMTYANRYCSDCNGVSANGTLKFRDWQPALVAFGADILYRDFLRLELIIEQTARSRRGFDNIHFIPAKAVAPAKCNTYDIQFCNQTGLLNTKNETMMNACLNGPDLPIIHSVGRKRLSVKNIACLHCNMDKDFSGDQNSCGYYEENLVQQPYMTSMSFNLQSTVSSEQRESSLRASYLGESSLRLLKQGHCPPGYAILQGTCREVICPRHHYLRQNQCVPLFGTLSGLDIHVRILVTPDRVITKDIAAEFEGKLEDMVNNILRKTVSLHVRHMSVMYLPNKKGNGKMYYLYDMNLYNSTGKIRFSQVIAEIKWFFREMNSQRLPKLSNGMNIGLKIEFAHKILKLSLKFMDLSTGKSLIIMKKAAWLKRIWRPDYEITNVHWCYRIGFSLSEVKNLVLGRDVYEIPSNPPVIAYETEIDADWINHKIYVCIDLIVAPTARADKGQTVTEKGNLDITVDDTNEALDRGAALVGTCLVIALLGFIFYKVRTHVREANPNTDVLVPRSQSLIELNTINVQSEQNHDQSEQRKADQSKQRINDQTHQRLGVHFDQRKDGHSYRRNYDQSEQRNSGHSEQGKNDQSEHGYHGHSEQEKDVPSKQGNDGQSEERNDCHSEQGYDGQSEQRKDGQSEQINDCQSEQRKDGQSEQRKDGKSEQGYNGQSEQGKDCQSEQDNDGQSEQGKDGQSEQGKDGQSEQGKDGQFQQGKDGQFEQGKDGQSEQINDGQFEQGKDGQFNQGKDGQSKRGNDGQSEQGKDGQPEQINAGQFEQGKDGQCEQGKDGQSGQGKGSLSEQEKGGLSEQENDGQSEQGNDGQSEQINVGQSEQGKDGQCEQGKYCQSEQGKDGQCEQGKGGQSEQGKYSQSEQGNDGQSEQGKGDQSEQINDGQSDQRNDGLCDQEYDGQSEQGNDGRSEQKNDGQSEQGCDGQSEQIIDGQSDQRYDGQSEQRYDGQSEQGYDGQSEQGKDGQFGQREDGQSEQRKGSQSKQREYGQSEQENDGQSEQRKNGKSEQGKDGQSEQGKDGQFEQRKVGQSKLRKDGQFEQRKDGQFEQRKDVQSEQSKDGQSEQGKDVKSKQKYSKFKQK